MKLTYYRETDSLYIDVSNEPAEDSDEVADGVVLDFNAEGVLVGINIQQASERFDLREIEAIDLPVPATAHR